MVQTDSTQEAVTTIESTAPQHVVRKTTVVSPPPVKGEPPQQIFETKKTIFRFNQVIWYILGVIEVLLTFRLILLMLGANITAGFANLIYMITGPLVVPFSGILGISASGSSMIDWSILLAGIVYLCIAWGLVYLLDLVYPITPQDI